MSVKMRGLIETETDTVLQCWRKRGPQKFGFTSLKDQCITINSKSIKGLWAVSGYYIKWWSCVYPQFKKNELVERKMSIDSVKI